MESVFFRDLVVKTLHALFLQATDSLCAFVRKWRTNDPEILVVFIPFVVSLRNSVTWITNRVQHNKFNYMASLEHKYL